MSDRPRRPRWLRRDMAPIGLVALLAVAVLMDGFVETDALSVASPQVERVSELNEVLGQLPDGALVLVGMDADLGTYPEIRPAVRALLGRLLGGGARLAFVSFTPEGRAIAAAEAARLAEGGASTTAMVELGFVPGAEAGLVLAVTDVVPDATDGPLAEDIRAAGGGIAAFDAAVVVGGVDFGPRSWVEQVATRLPALPLVGIAPTFAHPELAPYLRTGQLTALLATVRDDEAFRVAAGGDEGGPSSLGMLLGMLAAVLFIGRSLAMPDVGLVRPSAGEEQEGA